MVTGVIAAGGGGSGALCLGADARGDAPDVLSHATEMESSGPAQVAESGRK